MKEIEDFFNKELCNNVVVYNEFSLQHELGIYLRNNLKSKKVEFERNVKYFGLQKSQFIKKEIDISIYDNKNYCAIELKFPRNGQYPESMYNFCKDIKFLEELKSNGFDKCYFIALVDNKKFYSSTNLQNTGIYAPFRTEGANPIPSLDGTIIKPTGGNNTYIILNGIYQVKWQKFCQINKCLNGWRYCIIEVTLPKKGNVSVSKTPCKEYGK